MKAKTLFSALLLSGLATATLSADDPRANKGHKKPAAVRVQKGNSAPLKPVRPVTPMRPHTASNPLRNSLPNATPIQANKPLLPQSTRTKPAWNPPGADLTPIANRLRNASQMTPVKVPSQQPAPTGGPSGSPSDQQVDQLIRIKNCIVGEYRKYDQNNKLTEVGAILDNRCVEGGPSAGGQSSNSNGESNNSSSNSNGEGDKNSGQGNNSNSGGSTPGASGGSGSTPSANRTKQPTRHSVAPSAALASHREFQQVDESFRLVPHTSSERGVYDENPGESAQGGNLGPRGPLHSDSSSQEPCKFYEHENGDGGRTEYWLRPGDPQYDLYCPPEQDNPPAQSPPDE